MISIISKGTGTDSDGNSIELVSVTMTIEYSGEGLARCLMAKDKRYVSEKREIFNNINSKVPLQSIYLMYAPRYAAISNGKKDVIEIDNKANVETNIFVIKQELAEAMPSDYLNATAPKVEVTIIENPADAVLTANTKAKVKLRTNLHSAISDINSTAQLYLKMIYKNASNGAFVADNTITQKILQLRAADGRVLNDNIAINDKIYHVTIKISKINNDGTITQITEMSGTKVD